MNNISIESFLNFCDNMLIAEESATANLSDKQIVELTERVRNQYVDPVYKIYKKIINKHARLKKSAYEMDPDIYYDKNNKTFWITIDCFENYAYGNAASESEMKSLMKQFEKDAIAFEKDIKKATSKMTGIDIYVRGADFDDDSIQQFISCMINYIDEYGMVPSNEISLEICVDESVYTKLIPSENEIKEKDKIKYIQLYEEFIKFIKSPYKLGRTLWSAHIADICRIMNISSEKLNKIISKNIKSVGSKSKVFNGSFDEWERDISKSLGDCYTIDSWGGSGDVVAYSIKHKKLYWLCAEHSECEVFYRNFPYYSREFEDAAGGFDDELVDELRNLFSEYNKQHNIKYFD